MAIPPSYVDLGKSARDIFNKGYGKNSSFLSLYVKSDAQMPVFLWRGRVYWFYIVTVSRSLEAFCGLF